MMAADPWADGIRRLGISSLRGQQREIIDKWYSGTDCLVLLPTGYGKSLCYQAPSVSAVTDGQVTIVISPILALIQDQVQQMTRCGVQVVHVCSADLSASVSEVDTRALAGTLDMVYTTPETVGSSSFMQMLARLCRNDRLFGFVIDEAHCVVEWGKTFRPDYLALGLLKKNFPGVRTMALTATAPPGTRSDILSSLGITKARIFSETLNRPNHFYEVRLKKSTQADAVEDLVRCVYSELGGDRAVCGIVYCGQRKQTVQIAKALCANGMRAEPYHAGLSSEVKTRVLEDWTRDAVSIVVATCAFGMGINKPDVRFVVHYTLPRSMTSMYQEMGRGGRDGKPTRNVVFFRFSDAYQIGYKKWKKADQLVIDSVKSFCENTFLCRRVQILNAMGETDFSIADCNRQCDVCGVVPGTTYSRRRQQHAIRGGCTAVKMLAEKKSRKPTRKKTKTSLKRPKDKKKNKKKRKFSAKKKRGPTRSKKKRKRDQLAPPPPPPPPPDSYYTSRPPFNFARFAFQESKK